MGATVLAHGDTPTRRTGAVGLASVCLVTEGPKRSESEFLVVDDYGTGGIWFIVRAGGQNEIRVALPTVRIYAPGTRPEWMSEQALTEIATRRTYDLDSLPSSGWMTRLREGRR